MISDNEGIRRAQGGWLARQQEHVALRWVVVSCIALALGSIGTWVNIQLGALTATASGLDTWGKVTLTAAIVTVVPVVQPNWIGGWAWGSRHYLDVGLVAAWVSLGACVYNLFGNNGDGYGLSAVESPGWGLYLATAAAAGLIVWTIALRRVVAGRAQPPT